MLKTTNLLQNTSALWWGSKEVLIDIAVVGDLEVEIVDLCKVQCVCVVVVIVVLRHWLEYGVFLKDIREYVYSISGVIS